MLFRKVPDFILLILSLLNICQGLLTFNHPLTPQKLLNIVIKHSIFSLPKQGKIIMAEAAAAGRSLAGKPGRLKWTDKMNQDLLQCREKALSLKSSSNPP